MRYLLLFGVLLGVLFAKSSPVLSEVNGKSIVLPKQITRIYGSSPPITFMLYVIDDKPLIGVNAPQKNQDNHNGDKFLSEHFMKLPILGGWHGNNIPNLEEIIAANPQVIITWDTPLLNEKTAKDLARISIPALKVNIDDSKRYPEIFRELGKVLNQEDRANALSSMAKTYLDELEQFTQGIRLDQRTKVYYAEGDFGLQTECDISFHSEPLALAGGNLVHKCVQNSVMGMQDISFEQLLVYNPDVIIVQSSAFYKTVFTDSKWKMLSAVQKGRVFLVPKTPFNWIDRPPSFMRILGAHWIASKLYPDRYAFDIKEKVKAFYHLFFKVTLSDDDLKNYFYL